MPNMIRQQDRKCYIISSFDLEKDFSDPTFILFAYQSHLKCTTTYNALGKYAISVIEANI